MRKINACDGSSNESRKLVSKVELYRRDLRICAEEFEVQLAPAIAKAIQDVEAVGQTVSSHFPQRSAIEDAQQNIAAFHDKPPDDEQAQPAAKRKKQSRGQKALQAIADELGEAGILLPSAYDKAVREHVGMKIAVETERRLREGLAAEALDKLRLHLTTYQALTYRRRNVSGVINNTEVDRRLADKRIATDRAKYAYRKQRHMLRVLGMPEDDPKFKVL